MSYPFSITPEASVPLVLNRSKHTLSEFPTGYLVDSSFRDSSILIIGRAGREVGSGTGNPGNSVAIDGQRNFTRADLTNMTITLTGGVGGQVFNTGTGGAGGSASLNFTNANFTNANFTGLNITITGGEGGSGGFGGAVNGGNGGNATINFTGAVFTGVDWSNATIRVVAGEGHRGAGTGATNGANGTLTFTLTQAQINQGFYRSGQNPPTFVGATFTAPPVRSS